MLYVLLIILEPPIFGPLKVFVLIPNSLNTFPFKYIGKSQTVLLKLKFVVLVGITYTGNCE